MTTDKNAEALKAWKSFYRLSCEFGLDIKSYGDAIGDVLDHDDAISTALQPAQPITHPDIEAIQAARDALDRVEGWHDNKKSKPPYLMPYDYFFGDPKTQPNCGHFGTIRALLDAALAGQADAPEVEVPREATRDMLLSGFRKVDCSTMDFDDRIKNTAEIWRSMFDAAPQPPHTREPGEAEKCPLA